MKIEIYLLNEEQLTNIININNITKNYAVICDYGYGYSIIKDIDTLEGFTQHKSYIESQNIISIEIDIEEED
jgi:hypothetical protein